MKDDPSAVRWSDLAPVAPTLATAGERLFRAFTIGYLATVRRDGAPRIHPVTVTLADGGLFCCLLHRSRKAADLARDARYALHSFPCLPADNDWNDEEFMVGGHAENIVDVERRARVLLAHNDSSSPDDPLFELHIDRALHKHRVAGRAVWDAWTVRRGLLPDRHL